MLQATKYLQENQETLALYTTAITRAHGAHHPEVFEVKKVYTSLQDKIQTDPEKSDLAPEFAKFQDLTNHYAIPGDVCQTFTATYQMLEKANQLYNEKNEEDLS